jgi:hypothetical protein
MSVSIRLLYAELVTHIISSVWVNDYHLLLVPQMVRAKLPNGNVYAYNLGDKHLKRYIQLRLDFSYMWPSRPRRSSDVLLVRNARGMLT